MLPLIGRIVRDILEHYRERHQAVEAFEVANVTRSAQADTSAIETHQKRVQSLARDIQGFLSELGNLGVEFKGFELGLVDFPGELDGRNINWCWRYGEPSVQYWHEAEAGYDSRQPIEALSLSATHPR